MTADQQTRPLAELIAAADRATREAWEAARDLRDDAADRSPDHAHNRRVASLLGTALDNVRGARDLHAERPETTR